MLLPHKYNDVPFWYPLEIPDEDADDALLDLMQHDSAAPAWRGAPPRAGLKEHRRNGQPSRLVIQERQERDERDRQQRAEDGARHAATMAERKRQEAEWQAVRQHKADAERTAMLAHLRQEWIGLLEAMGKELAAVPRYRRLVEGVERDIAMIRDAPPGPLPWRLDRQTFIETFARLRAEADAPCSSS